MATARACQTIPNKNFNYCFFLSLPLEQDDRCMGFPPLYHMYIIYNMLENKG